MQISCVKPLITGKVVALRNGQIASSYWCYLYLMVYKVPHMSATLVSEGFKGLCLVTIRKVVNTL